jgi:hypothetical protein
MTSQGNETPDYDRSGQPTSSVKKSPLTFWLRKVILV